MAKEYARGDEVTIGGEKAVVTGTAFNNGNPEYTVAFQTEDGRPVSIGQRVAPQATANGQAETLALNAEREEEAVKESEKVTEEVEKEDADAADKADEESGDKSLPESAKSKPADSKTPATNSVPVKAGTVSPAAKK